MERRWLLPRAAAVGGVLAAAILAGVLLGSTPARAEFSVRVDIGNAPPAPHVVFRYRPHEVFYPDQRVYIVDDPEVGDYDCFRYGGYYWMFDNGYWYRSPRWGGRFMVVHPRYVPQAFYRMPPGRWKHHPGMPPGQMKKAGYGNGRHGDGRQGDDRQGDNRRGGRGRH